jgi:hypothetical protein
MGMITNIQDWMRGGSPRLPVPSSDMIGENGAKADFTSGADNRGQRLAWARYSAPWSLGSPYIAAQGGFINRERNLASTVATDFSTSNTTIATLIENLATHNVGAGLNLSSKIDGDAVGVTAE